MRLALLADIHGNLPALEAVLSDFNTLEEPDQVWILGDHAAIGTRPLECLAHIRTLIERFGKERCKVIGGNTDRWLVTGRRPQFPSAKDEAEWLTTRTMIQEMSAVLNWTSAQLTWSDYEFLSGMIGRELQTQVAGFGTVIGFHAIPGDDEAFALRPDAPAEEAADALLDREGVLAVCGHTHVVMDRVVGRWRVLNPGSVGMSATQPGIAEWAILTIADSAAQVDQRQCAYDLEAVLADARAIHYPELAFLEKRLRG